MDILYCHYSIVLYIRLHNFTFKLIIMKMIYSSYCVVVVNFLVGVVCYSITTSTPLRTRYNTHLRKYLHFQSHAARRFAESVQTHCMSCYATPAPVYPCAVVYHGVAQVRWVPVWCPCYSRHLTYETHSAHMARLAEVFARCWSALDGQRPDAPTPSHLFHSPPIEYNL